MIGGSKEGTKEGRNEGKKEGRNLLVDSNFLG